MTRPQTAPSKRNRSFIESLNSCQLSMRCLTTQNLSEVGWGYFPESIFSSDSSVHRVPSQLIDKENLKRRNFYLPISKLLRKWKLRSKATIQPSGIQKSPWTCAAQWSWVFGRPVWATLWSFVNASVRIWGLCVITCSYFITAVSCT